MVISELFIAFRRTTKRSPDFSHSHPEGKECSIYETILLRGRVLEIEEMSSYTTLTVPIAKKQAFLESMDGTRKNLVCWCRNHCITPVCFCICVAGWTG